MPYRSKIGRSLYAGYAECAGIAPDDEMILDAARAYPMDAITLVEELEDQAWPER